MIVDVILVGMAAEGAALWAYRAFKGRGPSPYAANLLSGAALLIAWRASASGAPNVAVAAALAASGLAHGLDLAARWRVAARAGDVAATIRWRSPRR